jgi:staphylococcal nuclease domain-containing protein 1
LTRLEKLSSEFAEFHAQKSAQPIAPTLPKAGDYVSAKFTADDAWYRARVRKVNENKTYNVVFIDYGNSESLPFSRLRPLDPKFSVMNLPAQAKEAKFAYITVPGLDADYGDVAYERIRDETEGRKLSAYVIARTHSAETSGTVLQLVLAAGSSKKVEGSINELLVSEGLATVDRAVERRFQANKASGAAIQKGSKAAVIAALVDAQDVARKSRNGVWQYGDFMGDENL